MNFYVVGFYKPYYGDALVYAQSGSRALTKVRQEGFTPNPGDRYLLGSKAFEDQKDYLEVDFTDPVAVEVMKEKARKEGVVIIWSQEGV